MVNTSAQRGIAPLIIIVVVGIGIVGVLAFNKSPLNKQPPGAKQEIQKAAGQKTNLYSNFDEQLSLEAPSSWQAEEYPESISEVDVWFLSPLENSKDGYRERVSLTIMEVAGPQAPKTLGEVYNPVNIDEIAREEFKETEGTISRITRTLLSQEETTLAGIQAKKFTEETVDTEGLGYKKLTYFFLKDNKIYSLTYTAEEQSFDKFLPDAEKIIKSFKFGPQEIKWRTHTNDQTGYTVKIPSHWKVTETPSETSREINIAHPKNKALVQITALKDEGLKDMNYLKSSVAEFKARLENDPDITELGQFKDQYDKDTGAFIARGFEKRNDKDWYFEQRGILSTKGRVVLMHGAVLGTLNKEYLNIIADIMDSLKIDN